MEAGGWDERGVFIGVRPGPSRPWGGWGQGGGGHHLPHPQSHVPPDGVKGESIKEDAPPMGIANAASNPAENMQIYANEPLTARLCDRDTRMMLHQSRHGALVTSSPPIPLLSRSLPAEWDTRRNQKKCKWMQMRPDGRWEEAVGGDESR